MIAILAILLLARGDYAQTPLSDWYRSLRQPGTGVLCCSEADCRPVEARTGAKGWEIYAGGRWVAVSPEKVLRGRNNPTGRAVACYREWAGEVVVFCLVPGPLV